MGYAQTVSALAPERRPSTVGRYRLIATLGSGGMAEVYLAVAQGPAGFNKLLVCKVLRPLLADDESFREMFLDEARLAARLNHPNVVQTYEVGEDDGQQFLTMEYLDGQPLHRVTGRLKESFPLELRIRVLALVLAGLQSAHELTDYDGTPLGVVHRDVSPPNVFVTYDGQVKLMDFGIAKTVQASHSTNTGVIKGKISYMAPEQALGEPVDARTDIFAVGVMLWEAITGRRLNAADSSEVVTLQRRISTPVESPLVHKPDADQELVAICLRAVAFSAQDRYASAQDMQEALEAYLEGHSLPARPRDLGRLVSEAFVQQRERLRALIEQQISAAASSSNIMLVELGKETTGSRGGGSSHDDGLISAVEQATLAPRTARPGSKAAIAAAVILPIAIAAIASARFAARPSQPLAPSTSLPAAATHDSTVVTLPAAQAASSTSTPTVTRAADSVDAASPPSPPPTSPATPAKAPGNVGPLSGPGHTSHNHPAPASHPSRTVDDKDPYAP
jgi:serine/threonine protein kinase